jgi:outer membrane protein assembly factor BamB
VTTALCLLCLRLCKAAAWLCLLALFAPAARGGDWPQILGPARNGVAAADERLAAAWPAAGPREVWRRPVGAGYAGLAVVGTRAILFHRAADREVVEALDAATGATLWQADWPTRFQPQVGGGAGPLCTPVVQAGTVITYGAQGVLAAHDLTTGRQRWVRETHREFSAPEGYFGAGSTPLVVAGRVIVNVGGRKGSGLAAFALDTGATEWTATGDAAGYSAPVAVDVAGAPHVLAVTRSSCVLVAAVDGAVRWSFPFGKRGPTVNAATPIVFPDGHLLVTASYGVGTVYAAFDDRAARPLWQGERPLATQYCTPVAVDGLLYAIDGRDDVPPANFICFERAGGAVRWTAADFGYGTLLAADGKLIVARTDGELLLVKPAAAEPQILSRARPFAVGPQAGAVRALPALSGGRLYLRNDATLTCLRVAP